MQTDTLIYKWDNVVKHHDWYDSTSVTNAIVVNNKFMIDDNIITYSTIGLLIYFVFIAYMLIRNKK